MTKKKAGSMKNAIYGGTHGNLSTELSVVDVAELKAGDLIEVMELSVGQEIKEIKIFNDAIGTGSTIHIFAMDKYGNNIEVTEEKDVASEGKVFIDNVDFYVGDNGPMVLYMALTPQNPIKDIVIPTEERQKGSSSVVSSFSIVFSANNIPINDVATAYPDNIKPPHAKIAIKWKSSDPSIAEIMPNGNIITKKLGAVDITGTDVLSGRSATKQFLVGANTVGKLVSFDIALQADGNPIASFDVKTVNPTLILENFVPANYKQDATKIKWSSSDPKVMTIAAGGVVTVVGAGAVNITAELDGVVKSLSTNVTANP